jgi:predicted nucleic acid-binding protein
MLQTSDVIIVDSDAFIAIFDKNDALFQDAFSLLNKIDAAGATLLYPSTMIAEATTTFQRKLTNQAAVTHIINRIKAREFIVEQVNQATIDEATKVFQPTGSKQNTFFDAIVAAIAKKHTARAVFSFDTWYEKVGLELVSTIM